MRDDRGAQLRETELVAEVAPHELPHPRRERADVGVHAARNPEGSGSGSGFGFRVSGFGFRVSGFGFGFGFGFAPGAASVDRSAWPTPYPPSSAKRASSSTTTPQSSRWRMQRPRAWGSARKAERLVRLLVRSPIYGALRFPCGSFPCGSFPRGSFPYCSFPYGSFPCGQFPYG